MLTNIKKHLFYAGILIFSIATFLEHAWLGETNLLCFAKGFACGIGLVGMVTLFNGSTTPILPFPSR